MYGEWTPASSRTYRTVPMAVEGMRDEQDSDPDGYEEPLPWRIRNLKTGEIISQEMVEAFEKLNMPITNRQLRSGWHRGERQTGDT
jgi:hypothetical protein